jgi:hypothetical protein
MAYINNCIITISLLKTTLVPLFSLSINLEQEITYEDTNPNFDSATGSPETHSETWFHVPQEEFSETHHITCTYTKLLGKIPTTSELPEGKIPT